eukprot:scaffold4242_cov175-Amphora_coffeaeformis.AAC.10
MRRTILLWLFHVVLLQRFDQSQALVSPHLIYSPQHRLSTTTTTVAAVSAPREDWQEYRGDARGAVLLMEDVHVYRGPAEILQGINWRVEPRQKWALVGANGAGKSSLFKAAVNEIPIGQGRVIISTTARLGYLQQTAVAGSTKTVYEEAASGMTAIRQAYDRMQEASERGDFAALEKATTQYEALGGYQQEQKVANVLKGLGFTNLEQPCSELSGGWQMRVALAKTLLSESTLTLLDEPSNHLDASAKKWLAQYLKKYDNGALILVTHDTDLLKAMDHIAEVIPEASGLQIYKSCNYEQYLALKEQRAAAAVVEFEKNQEKAAKLQAFVDRFGASATKASAAQSRVKQIERMQAEGLLEAPPDAVVAQRFKPSLMLPEPPKAVGQSLLALEGAKVGHDPEKVLVSNVSLDVQRGMKILVRGPNGAGKSTILHTLRGGIPLLDGKRIENEQLRLAFFTQDLAQELDPDETAVDTVTAYARTGNVNISDQDARGALGRLGLTGEKTLRKIRDLSGGEKARVALAMFSLKPSNLYLLDEASNHLDVECSEALSEAISEWGGDRGALVVVSHDRSFCQRIPFTHVATVQDGRLLLEERSIRESDWSSSDLSTQAWKSEKLNRAEANSNSSVSTDGIDPALRKKAFNAPKRIEKLERLIEAAESKIAEIDDKMMAVGNDVGKLVDLNEEKEKIAKTVEEYMEEWEELEELLAQVA